MKRTIDINVPVIFYDTSCLTHLGFDPNSDHFQQLLRCCLEGFVQLVVPYRVIREHAEHMAKDQLKKNRTEPEADQDSFSFDRAYRQSIEFLKVLFERNGAIILETLESHRKNAHRRMQAGDPPFRVAGENKDFNDALILEAVLEFRSENPEVEFHAAVGDRRLGEAVVELCGAELHKNGKVLIDARLNTFNEFSQTVFIPTEKDLNIPTVTEFGDETRVTEKAVSSEEMTELLGDMSEKLQGAQIYLLAAAELMFPHTDKDQLAIQLERVWGVPRQTTEAAALLLISEGHMQDLYGDYHVINEGFAEQAILHLGEGINDLMEALNEE